MRLIYSLRLARFLIDRGFYCHGTSPNPKKPWFDAYLFDDTPELEQEVKAYTEGRNNDKRIQ